MIADSLVGINLPVAELVFTSLPIYIGEGNKAPLGKEERYGLLGVNKIQLGLAVSTNTKRVIS